MTYEARMCKENIIESIHDREVYHFFIENRYLIMNDHDMYTLYIRYYQ